MQVTIVGCGDAWGSGGRIHTCFRLDTGGRTVVVDFGAAALVGWHRLGFDVNDIDAVFLSHLHGDHFGGLPFLLLESQFEARRSRPLVIAGPPGTRERLDRLIDVLFPGIAAAGWRFEWRVEEISPGFRGEIAGLQLHTTEVIHPSGAPATALRLSDGEKTFAYSGDTAWTDALLPIAAGADLFITECFAGAHALPNHIDWPRLKANLSRFTARRIAVTHLGNEAMTCVDDMRAAGLHVCADGQTLQL